MDIVKKLQELPVEDRKYAYREFAQNLIPKIRDIPGSRDKYELSKTHPIFHTFGDGFYLRHMSVPEKEFVVTEIHRKENVLFLLSGSCSILTESGLEEIAAPFYTVTKPGTQRIMFMREECVFVSVHPTKCDTVEEVEKDIIAKDFNDAKVVEYENKLKQIKQ